ncbi:unnamed protein product [Musa textilis]
MHIPKYGDAHLDILCFSELGKLNREAYGVEEQKILQLNILFFYCYSRVLVIYEREREREKREREREREREMFMQMHLAGSQHDSEYTTRGLFHPSLHIGNI